MLLIEIRKNKTTTLQGAGTVRSSIAKCEPIFIVLRSVLFVSFGPHCDGAKSFGTLTVQALL